MKLTKKMMAVLLTVSMLLSTASIASAAEIPEELEARDSSISDLMNLGSSDPLTGNETEPFNAAPDSNILMSKENELLLYASNYDKNSTDFYTIHEKMDGDTSYAIAGGTSPQLGLSYVTAAALNATGNGTDDHVAYLGVKDAATLRLVLYNARRDQIAASVDIGDVSGWIEDVEHYGYKTFISVTAGDYDGDGIDEIACTDHNMGVQMLDIHPQGDSGLSLSMGKRYDWSKLVSKPEDMKISAADINRRAVISLTTGNFDGTGAEELAVAVSTNHPGSSNLPNTVIACTTHVAVVRDPLNGGRISTTPIRYTEKGNDEEEQDDAYHHILYLGQIAAGDLDGDRMDEIAVAGYTGTIQLDGDGSFLDGCYEWEEDTISLCYAKLDGNSVGFSEITVDDMTPFIQEGFFADNDLLVPLSIDAAKLNGQYGRESVFAGGNVYQFSDGKAAVVYTHPFFSEESSYVYTDAYVEHVTSGIFGGADPMSGEPMINEQFVFTVVEKDNSQNEYNYKVGFISMSANQEIEAASFNDNSLQMDADGHLVVERPGGARTGCGTALVPVAVDIDDDGMLVRHTDTYYYYEDPTVEAVLQAAPYFDELGGWNDFGGQTTYSATVSRSLIDIWGYTHSIHFGFKGKLGAEKVGELELKVGYALDLDYEHEKTYTSSYTTTFNAGPYDTVVVQRTPYICYEYAYVDTSGNLLTGEDAGSVVFMEALHPVYFQLSVEEYNQFVDEYNAMADRHDLENSTADGDHAETVGDSYRLVKITEDILPVDATGNPENYYTTLRGGEYISRGTYALGTNGGSTVSEFAYEVETRYSAVYAHGLHFEIEGVVGDDIGIGGFAGLSFQETCGYGDATINASATGGEVANINPENYSATEQKTLNKYGFNWRSALWKKPLMVSADGSPYYDSEGSEFLVPVVGYVVTNVKSPMAAPTGVEAYLSGDGYEVTVDWIPSPDSGGALLGYYIYRSCDGEDPMQVNASLLSPTDSGFVDSTPLKPGKLYTYYVVARYDNGSAKYLTMNSKSSTVVWGIPQLPEYTDRYAGSMIGDGSMSMVMSMAALGIAVVALGLAVASRKKNDSADNK